MSDKAEKLQRLDQGFTGAILHNRALGLRFVDFEAGTATMLLPYDDKLVGNDAALRAEMEQRSGRRSVPQIFVGERHIGGYDDLQRLDKSGELDNILAAD